MGVTHFLENPQDGFNPFVKRILKDVLVKEKNKILASLK